MRGRLLSLVTAAVVAAGLVTVSSPANASQTLHVDASGGVSGSYETIQAAVNAAEPGDTVLIHPGTYAEHVSVATSGLVVRGTSRTEVLLDGGYSLQRGFDVTADDVEIGNLTVARYTGDGIFFYDQTGYLADHVTAFNNGRYGVYAYQSRDGVFRDSYASGNADSGFYIGGCWPCDALIENVYADYNGLGYSGTNAGGNLIIRDSYWRNNRAGIVPNTLDSEPEMPQRAVIVENNVVTESGDPAAPYLGLTGSATGIGIGVSGGNSNVIRGNTIVSSTRYGVAIFPFPETTPNFYQSEGNEVRENFVTESGLFDLALAAGSGERNCFAGNASPDADGLTSDPPAIETIYACNVWSEDERVFNPVLNLPVSGSPITAAELVATFAQYAAGEERPCTAARETEIGCADPRDRPEAQ